MLNAGGPVTTETVRGFLLLGGKEEKAMSEGNMKERNTKERKYCFECREPIKKGKGYTTLNVYDSPFDDTPKTIHLHTDNERCEDYPISCEEALYDDRWADFRYFDCPTCRRTIIKQCPSNGWHSYFREYRGEDICLSCYKWIILVDGVPRERFEERKIDGTFFNQRDLIAAGYTMVPGMTDALIRTQYDGEWYCNEALRLMDKGYAVVTDYERMAIGGLEGYVTLWARQKGGGNHDDK